MKTILKIIFIICLIWTIFTIDKMPIDKLILEILGLTVLAFLLIYYNDVKSWLNENAL